MKSIESLLQDKYLAGLECILVGDEKVRYNLSLLKLVKGKVLVDSTILDAENLHEIIPRIRKHPILLSINGKGIIHRKVARNEGDTLLSLLQKALPNASLSEFYVQESVSFNGTAFVSIIRRTVLNSILDEFSKQKVDVIGCTLGPFQVSSILSLLDISKDYQFEFSFSKYKLFIIDGILSDLNFNEVEKQSEAISLNEEQIDSSLLIAFASAFSGFISAPTETLGNLDRIVSTSKEYRDKKLFRLTGTSILSVFLLLIAMNFFISGHYKRKNDSFQAKVSLNNGVLAEFDTISKNFAQKQAFFKNNGLLYPSRLSFLADDIAHDLPPMIQLTEMSLNPLVEKHPDEAIIAFHQGQIIISGNCARSIELNDWILALKLKKWVRDAVLMNYSHDKHNTNGDFSISITSR